MSPLLLAFLALATFTSTPGAGPDWTWRPQESGSEASLRGLCAVDARTAWASGSDGTVLVTRDGEAWVDVSVKAASALDFRDVHGFDGRRAIVLSAGAPTRAYRTEDGGATWTLVYENEKEQAFFDALDFWDDDRGMAFSDPVDGRLLVIVTEDGGQTWKELEREVFPASPEGEAGFAASGTCLRVASGGRAWVGLGGTEGARLFRTADHGRSWSVAETPLRAGLASTGIFSVLLLGEERGVLVGGDYASPEETDRVAAYTEDAGLHWTLAEPGPSGFRSCVEVLQGRPGPTLVAVGSHGGDVSSDGGKTWQRISGEGYHVLSCAAPGVMWAAGSGGRIARLEPHE